MNIYSLIKKFNKIKSPRLKLLALYLMHVTGKRYLGIFLDPVLGCNLRCRMCYSSDEENRKSLKGVMNEEQLSKIAKAFFSRGLKLQIGCGAEPTLYKNLPEVISLGKEHKIPYISMTTNGLLLTEEVFEDCLKAGLDEITISLHGVTKEVFEYFMVNADHDKFCEMLRLLSKAKDKYNFKIRINYTINEDNLNDLAYFFDKFGKEKIDILQLRPIQKIGKSAYNNFNHSLLIEKYDIIQKVRDDALARNIICIAPSKEQIMRTENSNNNSVIFDYSYCYIDPSYCWKPDFDLNTDTFERYSKKRKLSKELFLNIFHSQKSLNKKKAHLNYEMN